jgi:hypothetical protein
MFDANEVKEKATHGGKLKPGETRCLKTVVTIVQKTILSYRGSCKKRKLA